MCEIAEHDELQQKMQSATPTPNADKALKKEEEVIASTLQSAEEIPGYRPTSNLDEHPSGRKPLSKDGKDAEHYGDGKLPEDIYYAEIEAQKLLENSEKAED